MAISHWWWRARSSSRSGDFLSFDISHYFQAGTDTDVSVVPSLTYTTEDGLSYQPKDRKCFKCDEVGHTILCWLLNHITLFHPRSIFCSCPTTATPQVNQIVQMTCFDRVQTCARPTRVSATAWVTVCWRRRWRAYWTSAPATLPSMPRTSWVGCSGISYH